MIKLTTPFKDEIIDKLKIGDNVLLSGYIYTARDAAHKRFFTSLKSGEPLPFDLKGNIIYYVGPTPNKPGQIIGSCGPTTSGRVDKYTPILLDNGLKGMIGKGERSVEVKDSIVKNKCVYFAAIGGAGALISKCVTESVIIAYEDLGTEAVRRLMVNELPLVVVIDKDGNNLYNTTMIELN